MITNVSYSQHLDRACFIPWCVNLPRIRGYYLRKSLLVMWRPRELARSTARKTPVAHSIGHRKYARPGVDPLWGYDFNCAF